MIRLTLMLLIAVVLISDGAVRAQYGLGSMMWPSNFGMNAQLGMAKAVKEPCSTGDLKFGFQWKYGKDFRVALNKCCDQYRPDGERCVPLCQNCANGFCKTPNECSCYANFHQNPETKLCESNSLVQCKISCENGFCDDEARCHCAKGFTMGKDGRCRKEKEEVMFCLKIMRKGKVCFTRDRKSDNADVYE